ncbi:hypothetical protein AB0N14_02215 [Streptomyces sp. NPDC051104]|uniref:hypothetical protein n=1 Tax=Streptomyces sp. NPDC051104 TaxID=3155044 RepID=UPI0034254686
MATERPLADVAGCQGVAASPDSARGAAVGGRHPRRRRRPLPPCPTGLRRPDRRRPPWRSPRAAAPVRRPVRRAPRRRGDRGELLRRQLAEHDPVVRALPTRPRPRGAQWSEQREQGFTTALAAAYTEGPDSYLYYGNSELAALDVGTPLAAADWSRRYGATDISFNPRTAWPKSTCAATASTTPPS